MIDIVLVESDTIEDKVLLSCHSLIAAFFPGKKIQAPSREQQEISYKFKLKIQLNNCRLHPNFKFEILDQNKMLSSFTQEATNMNIIEKLTLPGKESVLQISLKQAIVFFLTRYTKEIAPWGILTGIRPGKLMLKMDELGMPEDTQTSLLGDIYLVNGDKILLLQSVARAQKPFLEKMKVRKDLASLYISIPFCPSRCYYCSFPSNPLNSDAEKYLDVLLKELELIGETIRSKGLKVNAVYIGGGTPTVLNSKGLLKLLEAIRKNIPLDEELEYTVEAGRPDTIDKEKLNLLEGFGVNRISINPQSMQDSTLQRIGRRHTVADLYKSFELAKYNRDWIINMDLILGLPGEGVREIEDTVNKVIGLKPDNITVHSLAIKKGSSAWEDNYTSRSLRYWSDIQKHVHGNLESSGFIPYYLYRQKYIVGNLENVGYALPGKECHYNIAIIEEKQNIFGVGAGTVTKIMNFENATHKNIYHPIDLRTYMQGYEDVHFKVRQAFNYEHKY